MHVTRNLPQATPFPVSEFRERVERLQAKMQAQRLDALLLTSEANVEYVSGFWTLFAWNSPSRPWYLVLPLVGDPIGVIPQVGESNWRTTSWVEELRTWPSPRPEDEGVTLLLQTFRDLPRRFGRVGAELGPETRLGMTASDLFAVIDGLHPLEVVDGSTVIRQVREIKSFLEIERVATICTIASEAFAALPGQFQKGDSERSLAQKFQADLMLRGAEKTPYVAMSSGPGGYVSSSTWPSDRILAKGDVLMIDTGSRLDGYFCDFNRNFAFGEASDEVKRTHAALVAATNAGIQAVRPGVSMRDLFHVQLDVLEAHGMRCGIVGRFGHGLGKLMTEWPSVKTDDYGVLKPGMIMTIEPSVLLTNGSPMLHEEDVVVTDDGCSVLSRPAHPDIACLPLEA